MLAGRIRLGQRFAVQQRAVFAFQLAYRPTLAALFYTAMFSGYQQAVERDIGGARARAPSQRQFALPQEKQAPFS